VPHSRTSAVAALAVSLFLAGPAASQTTAASDERAVSAVEQGFLHSRITGDVRAVRSGFASDGVVIRENGDVRTKAELLAEIPGLPRWTSVEATERVVRLYRNGAVSHAIILVKTGTNPVAERSITTGAFVKQRGAWRMVSWQSTPIPESRPAPKP